MTDKRFQQINLPSDIIDTKNSKIYHTLSGNDGYGLCNLLNELHEENTTFMEALKELKEIGDYQAMRIKELEEENQKLQKENAELEKFRYSIFKRMGELYEEQ